tara:strand:- start:856 stop:1056 length:201 start_codon:yes stop_codon:yes gene_type:complete
MKTPVEKLIEVVEDGYGKISEQMWIEWKSHILEIEKNTINRAYEEGGNDVIAKNPVINYFNKKFKK